MHKFLNAGDFMREFVGYLVLLMFKEGVRLCSDDGWDGYSLHIPPKFRFRFSLSVLSFLPHQTFLYAAPADAPFLCSSPTLYPDQ